MTYRVGYQDGRERRRLEGNFTLDEAKREVRRLKSRGRTAWVEDPDGKHVPVPGAARGYSFLSRLVRA